ncbi:hypothetical protein HJFPF1_06495 [Paramyrothecium foliicola]|nr:hypothetical protein HJFPF1_06495 [Paramyrothecium foliicola]
MDQPSQGLQGADHIRSLQDDDFIFKAFDAYPWKKDPSFMSGLYAILGDPNMCTSLESLKDMATHARIFYYSQRIGTTIDFSRYQAWISEQSDHLAPDVLPEEYRVAAQSGADAAAAAALPWQQAAPKAELFVDKRTQAQAGPAGEPNYPMAFAEMLKLLQEGKPIPGIKQIPNTVIRNPSVKPVGTRAPPRKPWEKSAAAAEAASVPPTQHGQSLDADFPPLEAEEAAVNS